MIVKTVEFTQIADWAKPNVLAGYQWGCQCGESYSSQEAAESCKNCRKYGAPREHVYFTPLPS